jgi:hypothetical protein
MPSFLCLLTYKMEGWVGCSHRKFILDESGRASCYLRKIVLVPEELGFKVGDWLMRIQPPPPKNLA